ncbi:MAG: 5-(carboxyamino)imidazole ribonucleotide synthase [Planctomycetes bacterium]|nr:5-(carboxyamino)imidazole ribonucleotide synthase [Planctomycetota bacterium]MCB9910227.1 5-(carboxyamino)imidazole ribonucleotide synthase [Planctomycetota bacterium]
MSAPILPGAVLGVLGGGQLGRMFTLAARRMGYRVDVFAPEDDTPAGQIAYREIRAPYEDLAAVRAFAKDVEVVTFEFENVSSEATAAAAEFAPVRPSGALLHVTQNRGREKRALEAKGIPVAPFAIIESQADLDAAAAHPGFPGVLKTTSWGYDGRGQRRVEDRAGLANAFRELGSVPCVLEGFIPFVAELSVVGARGLDGSIALYDPVLNRHRNHILDITLSPAPVASAVRTAALDLARRILEGFDVVGVLCVELFLLDDDSLVVNELAPRPHNSGHITIDANVCCQFEQQVRAVCGLPLGSTERTVPAAAMANLLGDLWQGGPPNWAAALADPGVRLHLYGKEGPVPGRKMGHLTVADSTLEGAEARVLAARKALLRR